MSPASILLHLSVIIPGQDWLHGIPRPAAGKSGGAVAEGSIPERERGGDSLLPEVSCAAANADATAKLLRNDTAIPQNDLREAGGGYCGAV